MSISFRLARCGVALAAAFALAEAASWAGPSNAPGPVAEVKPPVKVEGFVVQPPFVAPAIPQSVYVRPKLKEEGRDPFFPKSTMIYGVEASTTKTSAPVVPVAELFLRGISGSDAEPLAIINTTTFGVGDELDVTTKAGKMRIRCVEINKAAGTALIQVGGERRELRLPPLK